MTVSIKKLIFLLLALYSSLGLCQEQYADPANMQNMFQLDTTSIIKDGDFVIFKYKDDVSNFPASNYNYVIHTVKSQCNDINIELIDEEAQLRSDNQVKNIFKRNYLGKKYQANKAYDLLTKYACAKANETTPSTISTNANQPTRYVPDSKSQEEDAQKLCKSYGLKKGTKGYVDCMLKIREQDLNKEAKLQKNSEDATRAEQILIDEKNKKQLENIKAAQEKRIKDDQDAALRVEQQRAYQLQQIKARCDNARQNMGIFCAQANKPKDNPYAYTDLGATMECTRWQNEVSNVCR